MCHKNQPNVGKYMYINMPYMDSLGSRCIAEIGALRPSLWLLHPVKQVNQLIYSNSTSPSFPKVRAPVKLSVQASYILCRKPRGPPPTPVFIEGKDGEFFSPPSRH